MSRFDNQEFAMKLESDQQSSAVLPQLIYSVNKLILMCQHDMAKNIRRPSTKAELTMRSSPVNGMKIYLRRLTLTHPAPIG